LFASGTFTEQPFSGAPGYLFGASVFSGVAVSSEQMSGRLTFSSSTAETTTVSDAPFPIASFLSFVSETTTVSDAPFPIASFLSFVSESASGVEVTSATTYFGARVNEVAIPIDVIFTNFTVNAAVAELIQGVDRPFAQTTVFSFLASSASYSDMVMARLQWEPINTNASAVVDWKLINTSI